MTIRSLQQSRLRSALALLVVSLLLGAAGVPAAEAKPPPRTYEVEEHYAATGTWAIGTAGVTDASGNAFELFYPTELGAGGFQHPILTWGNGTGASPGQYVGVLGQLASWGFVVVASTSATTGKGTEMLAGVHYLLAENDDPSSIFYQKLGPSRVGALGHSQEAGGAVNAANLSGGVITTTVLFNLPDRRWVGPGDEFSVAQLSGPVLFFGASNDRLISPPRTLEGYYDEVPGAAALAVLKGANHNTVQGSGGGYFGYLTAWMMYLLQGDDYARGTFVGRRPELNVNKNWTNQAEKDLP